MSYNVSPALEEVIAHSAVGSQVPKQRCCFNQKPDALHSKINWKTAAICRGEKLELFRKELILEELVHVLSLNI